MSETIEVDYLFNIGKAEKNISKISNNLFGLDKQQSELNKNSINTFGLGKKEQKISKPDFGLDKKQTPQTPSQGKSGIGIAGIAGGNILAGGILGLFGKIFEKLPKITGLFAEIGDIILDNIVKPVNDYVLPVLEEVKTFVKENTKEFEQIGVVITSVFRLIFDLGKSTFETLSIITKAFFNSVFGEGQMTFSKIINLLNLAVLKIAFLFTFAQMMIEPILTGIGKSLAWLTTNAVIPFGEGFVSELQNVLPWIEDVMNALNEFVDVFKDISGESSIVKDIFYGIGKVLGFLIFTPFKLFLNGITTLIKLSSAIVKNWGNWGKMFSDIKEIFFSFVDNVIFILSGGKITQGFTKIIDGIKQKFSDLKVWVSGIVTSVKDWFSGISDAISSAFTGGLNTAKTYVNNSFIGKGIEKLTGEKLFSEPEPKTTPTGDTRSIANNSNTTNNNNVQIKIDGSKNPTETAKAVQAELQKNSLRNQFNKTKTAQGM